MKRCVIQANNDGFMFLEMSNPPTKCHDSTENHEGARYIVIYDPLVFILSVSLYLSRG